MLGLILEGLLFLDRSLTLVDAAFTWCSKSTDFEEKVKLVVGGQLLAFCSFGDASAGRWCSREHLLW
jgi:hypothetical protein